MAEYSELGRKIEDRHGALKALRSPWETLWRDIASYVVPRRSPGLNGIGASTPSTQAEALLFDTTAVRANMTLANGQLAWMSPLEAAWFAFEPPAALKKQGAGDAQKWLAEATETARNALAVSNFYTAVHEFYLDRGAFGTACLYVEPGRRNMLNAQTWPVGSFVIDEDENGQVDTVIREFKLTPRQAIQKFGEDKVSAKLRKAAEKGGAKAHDRVSFLHAVYPREDAERDSKKIDDVNMPIASVYMECDGCFVVKVSGYEESPVMVSRYLEWGSSTGGMYGWSPAFAALPEARQVNFLQKMLDALAEKTAFPPILAPDELEGEIDANAMGVTYFSAAMTAANAMPKEWMTQGRYDIGLQRVQERQKAINDAFHVDLFQMFAQLEKQMTAREVSERSQEKLIQFSPTFSRLTSELFNPLLERVFGILLRGGQFGPVTDIPQSMVQPMGDGRGFVPTPQVQYSSRIALALRSLPGLAYMRALDRLTVIAPIVPDVLDNYDLDKAERQTAIADGLSPDCLREEKERDDMRQQRAEAQQQAEQQAAMANAADALSKAGRVPADTPVGKIIASNLPGQQQAA